MFRSHQFIATCFAIFAMGSTMVASAVAAPVPATKGDVVEITDLQPFTHVAYIPAGSDLSSIKIESIKAVKVAGKRRAVTNQRYCDQPWSDPGGSMYCHHSTDESYVPAYRVTYSYRGQPMTSDEYGNTYFTFSVNFRPDEITPKLREVLSSDEVKRTALTEFLRVTTSRDSAQQVFIDEAHSTFCDGNYVDGNWMQTNPKCEDRIAYRKATSPSAYITVRVDAASHLERAAAGSAPWQK